MSKSETPEANRRHALRTMINQDPESVHTYDVTIDGGATYRIKAPNNRIARERIARLYSVNVADIFAVFVNV